MGTKSLLALLQAWRDAERRWEGSEAAQDVQGAGVDVLHAWAAYQNAALGSHASEFMLVADDDGAYVAATDGVTNHLGYRPDALIGMHIADLAAPELRETTPTQWAAFLADGRQDGQFRLRALDGTLVSLHYQARAHHPVPRYHMSRMWPVD